MQATKKQVEAYIGVLTAIVETIEEIGFAPSGILYVALMPLGITLDQYEQLMATLVETGRIRKHGNVYYPVNCEVKRGN